MAPPAGGQVPLGGLGGELTPKLAGSPTSLDYPSGQLKQPYKQERSRAGVNRGPSWRLGNCFNVLVTQYVILKSEK